jgi:uncharacterized protein (TIGR00255 family)
MIKSMTGFGAAKANNDSLAVTVEIRTLNSKSLDASFRLPRQYSDKELELRTLLTQTLERGKINLSIELQQMGEAKPKVSVNQPIVRAYYGQLKRWPRRWAPTRATSCAWPCNCPKPTSPKRAPTKPRPGNGPSSAA